MTRSLIAIFATLFVMGCAGTHTTVATTKQEPTETPTVTYEPIKDNSRPMIPGIEEVGNSRWGAKYTIFVSPQWDNPIVFEIVPTGNGGEDKVRVQASGEGSFPITAKTNPSRVIITYQDEDGVRRRVCTMRGLEVFMNLQRTGFGMDGVDCEFLKVFHWSDVENNVAAQ